MEEMFGGLNGRFYTGLLQKICLGLTLQSKTKRFNQRFSFRDYSKQQQVI